VSKTYRMSIAIILLTFIPLMSVSSSESTKLISQADLIQILPSDADLKNIKRQQKAFKRGFYWTTNKTLKPLEAQHSAT
jgi:hypothetical protein